MQCLPFVFKTNRKFKTIVIYNIENLANNSQAALRRTMELYARTCRFVKVCNNLSKIFDPLRSRCRTFCVPSPSIDNIMSVVTYITIMENIKVEAKDFDFIKTRCHNNLKKAIWMLDCKRLGSDGGITLDEVFDQVVEQILSVRTSKSIIKLFHDDIRGNIYNILITTIKGSEIITVIMDELIKRIDDDEVNARIIQYASQAEYNLIHGRRDIMHIDFFIAGVMRELIQNKKAITKSSAGKKVKKIVEV